MKVTCRTVLLSQSHRSCDDMSFRQSISGFRKKVKEKVSKIRNKTGKGPNAVDEGFDHSTLSLQSEPAVAVGGEFKGGEIEVCAGKDDPGPDNSPSVSPPVVGIGRSQGESDDRVRGGETSQKDLDPHPHVQIESGSSQERREVERSQGQELDPP